MDGWNCCPDFLVSLDWMIILGAQPHTVEMGQPIDLFLKAACLLKENRHNILIKKHVELNLNLSEAGVSME
jgi:hypothetical protein